MLTIRFIAAARAASKEMHHMNPGTPLATVVSNQAAQGWAESKGAEHLRHGATAHIKAADVMDPKWRLASLIIDQGIAAGPSNP